MKILIFGATGQVGSYCKTLFEQNGHEVIAPQSRWNPGETGVDISNEDSVFECIHRCQPDVVINAAAYNDVDGAEEAVGKAFRANALGPMNIALNLLCLDKKCKFITFSSEYVFDGHAKHPYQTTAQTNPLSVYGRSKLLGEQAVESILKGQDKVEYYIIRTSWVFSNMKVKSNFVWRLLNLLKTKKNLSFVDDQHICPTYAGDLAIVCQQLVKPVMQVIRQPENGIYHAVGYVMHTPRSWAQDIVNRYGGDEIIGTTSLNDYKTKAQRPRWCVLDTWNLDHLCVSLPGNPTEALHLPEFDALKEE